MPSSSVLLGILYKSHVVILMFEELLNNTCDIFFFVGFVWKKQVCISDSKKFRLQNTLNFFTTASMLSIRAGSRPKQPATGQSLAGYFLLTLLLILVRNLN